MRILVCGLPGSGKTSLTTSLAWNLNFHMFNADIVRTKYEDWDFSDEGRDRQLRRMIDLSYSEDNTICDFVCPFEDGRNKFSADFVIWMDTIPAGRFEDTNKVFQQPQFTNLRIPNLNYDIATICNIIKTSPKFDK
jgi:adenylylsulfate kinase